MDPATFLTELKRRKVYRVAVAYAIVAWLLIQGLRVPSPLIGVAVGFAAAAVVEAL